MGTNRDEKREREVSIYIIIPNPHRNMVSRRVKLAARGARRPRMRWGVYEYLAVGSAPALYTFSGLYRELASPDSGTEKNALEIELRLVHELPVY